MGEKPPRMVLMPGEIKMEQESDEEGTVHLHESPMKKAGKVKTKPTARKSTTPRMTQIKQRYSQTFIPAPNGIISDAGRLSLASQYIY
jgi:hypothetical protein